MSGGPTTITLRALEGKPLDNGQVRAMVTATAQAIAERQGVVLQNLSTTPSSITATIHAGRIEAIGFVAELRRLTTNWYTHKFGDEHLWGAMHGDAEGEEWKQ